MWTTLKNWGGALTPIQLNNLHQIGMVDMVPLPPQRYPGNTQEYTGLKVSGNKAEFQKILDGLAATENQLGLMQVRTTIIKLPATVPPNYGKPTYVDAQFEIVGPVTK
jgi:hypothetical protein